MKNPTNLKTILLIAIVCVVVIAAQTSLQSETAKDRGLDLLFLICAQALFVVSSLRLLKENWNVWKVWGKVGLALTIILQTVMMVKGITDYWPRLPWVKAEAFTTVDEFMLDLREKDYAFAMMRLTPSIRRCVKLSDLSQPDARPISWNLNEMNKYSNILGTATFSDGQELPITLRMEWSDNHWEINGFWFGMGEEEKLDYSSCYSG